MTHHNNASRRCPRHQSGLVAMAPLAVVALAAFMLSACHSTPTLAAKPAAVADVAAACAAPCAGAPAALQPFDEHFYTAPVDAAATAD